jgi:hypothetical protein
MRDVRDFFSLRMYRILVPSQFHAYFYGLSPEHEIYPVLQVSRDSAVRIATRWSGDRIPSIPTLLYDGYRVYPGGGADHSSHLAPRLKEQNYNSTPPLGLRGLF